MVGNDEDPKEYHWWKAWVSSRCQQRQKGAFIYILLTGTGKALEAVEHLDSDKFQKEGGDQVLLFLLDSVFLTKMHLMKCPRT